MKVFVTGATGFVGSAVVRELIGAGHKVLGLSRSGEGAERLRSWGAEVHRGDLDDLESLKSGAAAADGVIHTAFNHDFSRYRESCEADRNIIEALGSPLAGSDRPLLVTSGIGILPQGGVLTEEVRPAVGAEAHPRAATEETAEALSARGLNISIVRLPPSVHGEGDHGFVPLLVNLARETGVAAYIGEGQNRWPAVHRLDAARLYRLALEKGLSGARYHAVDEAGLPFRAIAEAIGRGLALPAESRAADHFGWFGHFAAMNVPAESTWTREVLQWEPKERGLLADLSGPSYFRT